MSAFLQYALYLALLILLALPLGRYISRAMQGERVFLTGVLAPCERLLYRALGVDQTEQMGWKRYAASALLFSLLSFVLLFLILMCQGFLPLNPEKFPGNSWHLAFNTAWSFVTNTNWQAYSGEACLSYFSQMFGLTVQNFVTPAVGLAVLFALIRGFVQTGAKGLGSFWVDVTRATLYVLLPLCFVMSIALISQGVPQTFRPYETVQLLEPVTLADGTVVTEQVVPLGPEASQVAIKQAGTNGGGFNGTNAAHPLENPNNFTNLLEMLSLLLLPAALCFSFGLSVQDKRQGRAIFLAMCVLLVAALAVCGVSEQAGTPQLSQNGAVNLDAAPNQPGGNMEGKEARFGVAASVNWAVYTTAASNGSVNSMHDSYTPLGGLAPMLLMQLGEVVFGGVGCGLYGMVGFVLLTVFIAGLMVGRTPEYLGKKIGPFEMRMSVLLCLATPFAILIGSGVAALLPQVGESLNNPGAHGFSELLYAYSSAGGNNGSAFAGFNANTPFLNVSLGLVMAFARFLPMVAALAIAGSMAGKKRVAQSAGTLPTHNALFIGLLIFVVLLIGALSFFPALALGPIAEHFGMVG